MFTRLIFCLIEALLEQLDKKFPPNIKYAYWLVYVHNIRGTQC